MVSVGTALLSAPVSHADAPVSLLDALFTATSAVCVTGLIVVDTGSAFSHFGHVVILVLMQLGGLGILTYTSLVFYLLHKRVSITDRVAVGQTLMHDPSFRFGRFLLYVALGVFSIEAIGVIGLMLFAGPEMTLFSAIFHSVSGFCNAGFSLHSDSLERWRGNFGVNAVMIVLIYSGGLGFSVIVELVRTSRDRIREQLSGKRTIQPHRLSWHTRTVIGTSSSLVLFGFGTFFVLETWGGGEYMSIFEHGLSALFQSVSARTAGFNTVDISQMTTVSILLIIALMYIGGSPGSCAGGIKTTTFRVVVAFIASQFRGRKQTVIGGYALHPSDVNRALTLAVFTATVVVVATILLCLVEQGAPPHEESRGDFLIILFETVSAYCTVGLSMGITSELQPLSKVIVIILMFTGRLGPILFISLLQSLQKPPRYQWPENRMLIG